MTVKEIKASPQGYGSLHSTTSGGSGSPPPHGSFHLPASQGTPFSPPPVVFDLNQVGGTSQLPLSNHLKGTLSHDSQTQSNDLLTAPVPYGHV